MSNTGRLAKVLFRIFVAIAIARTVALLFFMVDPLRTGGSPRSFDLFYLDHNCLTAYFRGAELATQDAENLYLPEQYRPAGKIGRFDVDEFYYPPQFLLLPRLLMAIAPSFLGVRLLWFLLEVGVLALALVAINRFIEPDARPWWMVGAAVFWASTSNMITLQVGNLQPMAFAMAVLAMVAFDRGKGALGGGLLAFATLSKIYPGILLVYLLAKKRYRDLAHTAVFGLIFTVVAWLVFGLNPYLDFVQYMLPRIASNEAFAFLDLPQFWWLRAINHSIPGLGQKVGNLIGVMPTPGFTRILSTLYSVVLLALAWWAGKRQTAGKLHDVQLWLVLVTLGALRSPFVPDIYAMIGPLWIWALLVAEKRGKSLGVLALLFVPLVMILPLGGGPDLGSGKVFILWSLIAEIPALALIFWMLFRQPNPPEPLGSSEEPSSPLTSTAPAAQQA